MWKSKKQPLDERIEKENNRISGKMYYLMNILMIVSIVVKLYYKVPVYVYALELLALAVSGIFFLVSESKYGILFLKEKDEELLSIHNKILTKAMMISFWIIIIGEIPFPLIATEYMKWTTLYFVIWGIPALIITFLSIKNGWLIWGTKKKEKNGKQELKKRVVIGALFYGLIMGFPELFQDGAFQVKGLLWIFGMAAGWGIPFYLIFVGIMKISEKNADKNVVKKELEYEE